MTTHNDVLTLQSNRLGAKSELDQLETVVANDNKVELDAIEQDPSDVVVSAYADLTTKETVFKFKRLFIIGFLVSFSGVYLGFTLTVPGSIVANQGFVNQFGTVIDAQGKLELNAQYVGLWSAINFVSQVLFQFISPFSANRLGFKFNMYVFSALITIATVLEIVAKTWWHYLMYVFLADATRDTRLTSSAKIFCGFAAGFIGTSVMAYVSEITMSKMRGVHLSAFSFAYAVGQGACAIALEIINRSTPLDYRRAFYAEFAILGVWLPILVWLPESPAWYYKRGRHDDARKSCKRLIGNVDGYDWDREYAKASRMGIVASFKGTNLRRTLISTIPFSMQSFVGGPLMFNVPYFYSLIGLENVAFTSNLIVTGVLMGGILVSFYLVDKVGRRPLLLCGGPAMSACVFVVGGLGFTSITPGVGRVLVAMSSIWVFAYAISVAPIGWLSLVENSSPMLRAQTAGIAAVMQSCSGVLFNYTVPLMLSDQYAGWGSKIGFFFGPLAALFTILVWFTVPETKGRTYAELDELYERRIPAWRFDKEKTTAQQAAEALNA